jgi:uncharacterized membrane protein (TIGR02234 family)
MPEPQPGSSSAAANTPDSAAGHTTARRTFGPTVLAGLASAVLFAVAATREWATTEGRAAGIRVEASVTGSESEPLVAALALLALASWGVVLVLRGRARQVLAGVGLLAATAGLAAVLLAFGQVQDDALAAAVARGATDDTFTTSLSPWYYLTAVGALVTALAFLVAVRTARSWPAMGSKYDAPTAPSKPVEEDMWRALDEGRDPTS